MKGLTIRQPYAHLIVIGEKRVENRSRQTAHRGPVVIHAGKARDCVTQNDLERYPDMAFGALVGCAELVACLRMVDLDTGNVPSRFAWVGRDPHAEGPWCWVLGRARAFIQPIPWRGEMHLFDVPDEVIERFRIDRDRQSTA